MYNVNVQLAVDYKQAGQTAHLRFCPPPFQRKAEGLSFWLSILPSVCPSVLTSLYLVGHNSAYSFIPILSKLHWCFGQGLKICMWLGFNPQLIFCPFFCKWKLAIFRALSITKRMDRGNLVGAAPPTILYQLFRRNFTGVLVMV